MSELAAVCSRIREVRCPVAEHEVFLSFNDDVDAVMFDDWLHTEGFNHFRLWRARNHQDYR
jgi:hypothetical protein